MNKKEKKEETKTEQLEEIAGAEKEEETKKEEEEISEKEQEASIEAVEDALRESKKYQEITQKLKKNWAVAKLNVRKKAFNILTQPNIPEFIINTIQDGNNS